MTYPREDGEHAMMADGIMAGWPNARRARVMALDAARSFNAKAGLVLEKMRKAREGQT